MELAEVSMMQSGTLTEISPFGTGFIEIENRRVLDFHHSMLITQPAREQWPLLEGRRVVFEVSNGSATNVQMVEAVAHSASRKL
jgi:hypothetical protein